MKANRRKFMGDAVKGGAVLMFPTIIQEKVLGGENPSKKIQQFTKLKLTFIPWLNYNIL